MKTVGGAAEKPAVKMGDDIVGTQLKRSVMTAPAN